MKISPKQFQQVMEVYRNQMQKTTPTPQSGHRDSLSLSGDAKAVKEVREMMKFIPEVRQEKVDALKTAIEQGEYKVDGEQVAEKLLQRMAVDRFMISDD